MNKSKIKRILTMFYLIFLDANPRNARFDRTWKDYWNLAKEIKRFK